MMDHGLIERSKAILREQVPQEYLDGDVPMLVNFSGGKDSLCCLLLALEVSDKVECFYMDAGFELPTTLPYVKDRCKELGVKLHVSHPLKDKVHHRDPGPLVGVHSFTDYIEHYGYFPASVRRWCSIWCKQRPGKVYLRKTWGRVPIYKLVGVRRKESQHRSYTYGVKAAKKYGGLYRRPDHEMTGSFLVYPILDWSTDDVWAYLKDQEVEVHDGYKCFGVSGCKWCPIHKPETVAKIAEVFPHLYDDLVAVEEKINKPAWFHRDVWLRDVVKQ